MCLHTCPIFAQITQPILTTQSFSHDNAIETVSLNAKQEKISTKYMLTEVYINCKYFEKLL